MKIRYDVLSKKEKPMYEYTNSYHNTVTRSRRSPSELEVIAGRLAQGTASDAELALARRMRSALCGSADCTCGDVFGIRE